MGGLAGPLLYYVHIFKNAGNTMREVLWRNRGPGEFIDVMIHGRLDASRAPKTFGSPDEDVRELLNLISGNVGVLSYVAADLPFGLHHHIARPVRYLALLREPVDRCTSYWYYAYKRRAEGPMWSVLEEHGFDVAAAVEKSGLIQYSNDQVRCILGSSKLVMDTGDLSQAVEVIRASYDLVGTVTRLEDCLRLLAGRYGWRGLARTPRLNVGDRADQSLLPPRAAVAFHDLNEIDMALYRWVEDVYLPAVLP
jgi:hypothetical protein